MHVDAIVLRRMPWREHDQLVVLYARQLGKVAAVAKGSQRAASRQAPALDAGSLISCRLVPGRGGMPLVTGAQTERAWSSAKESALRWATAAALLEAVDALCFEGQPDDGVWSTLTGCLAGLDDGDADAVAVLRSGQAALLAALGHGIRPAPADIGRSSLDDACEQVAQRPLAGPALVYGLARGLRNVVE